MSRTSELLIALEENERIDVDAEYVFIPGVGIYPRYELTEPTPEPEDEFSPLCTPPELYPSNPEYGQQTDDNV